MYRPPRDQFDRALSGLKTALSEIEMALSDATQKGDRQKISTICAQLVDMGENNKELLQQHTELLNHYTRLSQRC